MAATRASLLAPEADRGRLWLWIAALAVPGVGRRRPANRLYLVSLAFLSAAGFLGLHALSTPGVLLDGPNQGFAVATPIGLLVSGLFAGASALPLRPDRARAVMHHARLLRGGLLALMALWAARGGGVFPLPPRPGAPSWRGAPRRGPPPRRGGRAPGARRAGPGGGVA